MYRQAMGKLYCIHPFIESLADYCDLRLKIKLKNRNTIKSKTHLTVTCVYLNRFHTELLFNFKLCSHFLFFQFIKSSISSPSVRQPTDGIQMINNLFMQTFIYLLFALNVFGYEMWHITLFYSFMSAYIPQTVWVRIQFAYIWFFFFSI